MSAKEAAVVLTVMIFMINLGLLAFNASDTGFEFSSVGGGFTYDDLNSTVSSLRPPNAPDTDCDPGTEGFLCVLKGTFNTIAGAGQFAIWLLDFLFV